MNTREKLTEAINLIDQVINLNDQVINRNVGSIGHVDLPAEALASKQKLLSGLNTDREVFDIVNAINVLAMANTDVIHIFTSFLAHVSKFNVHALAIDTVYQEGHPHIRLINEDVRFDREGALEKLLSIESQLTELIIEAREKAEAKAEVEA
ncbi:hypothetical protein B6A42_13235 [Vibrio coralliilyticus]|nr:hypothetical protein B6A42_13235 [Vibrio coralliilyticus]